MGETVDEPDARHASFRCQIDFLKLELETINAVTGQIDRMTQAVKNWCVVVWAGSLAILLGQDLEGLVFFTAVLPIPFWFVDAYWRQTQRSFIFRTSKISEFLNSDRLLESFRQQQLVDFTVLDPKGRQYYGRAEYESYRSLLRIMCFGSVMVFYLGLILMSILAGIIMTLAT